MFEKDTGQVFREWTVPAPRPQSDILLDWSRKPPPKDCDPPKVNRSGSGSLPSLVDMAMKVAVKNSGKISREHLEHLPTALVLRLWLFLEPRGVCLQAWKAFSLRLLAADKNPTLGLHLFRQHICRPEGELKRYIQPLSSASVDFIAHLVISGGSPFTVTQLLSLADMKNLGALELKSPADRQTASYPQVTDRLVRGWSEAKAPFPLLRILRIWGDEAITKVSLRWAAKFPSLVLYDVMGTKDGWKGARSEADSTGWQVSQELTNDSDEPISQSLKLLTLDQSSTKREDLIFASDYCLSMLCSASRWALNFVTKDDAPSLLELLSDLSGISRQILEHRAEGLLVNPTKMECCQSVLYGAWVFWLYSVIGQLSNDRDLEGQGLTSGLCTRAGPFVLPSKPMACLFLGHYYRGDVAFKPFVLPTQSSQARRFIFTRPSIMRGESSKVTKTEHDKKENSTVPAVERQQPLMRQNKKRRLQDILGSFG